MQVLNGFRLCSNFVSRFPLIYTDRIFEGIKKKKLQQAPSNRAIIWTTQRQWNKKNQPIGRSAVAT